MAPTQKSKASSTVKKTRSTPSNKLKTLGDTHHPSAAALFDSSRMTTEQWYRSKNTTRAYAGYVKAGKVWLDEWAKEPRDDEESQLRTSMPEERSIFLKAFDSIGEHTPSALHMLTVFKCDHLGLKFATAEGLRSSFKSYFQQ